MKQETDTFLSDHKTDIDWLFAEFGDLNSADLELASTIIYVDREFFEEHQHHQIGEIVARVNEIKPHFSKEVIQKSFDSLFNKGLILSTK